MNRILKVVAAVLCAATLAGCAGQQTLTELPMPKGPEPVVMDQHDQKPLACVAAAVAASPSFKKRSVGVLDVLDKTGAENKVGNDSFGTFMSQGTADMLMSALGTMGAETIELSPSYKIAVDWLANKGAGTYKNVQALQKPGAGPDPQYDTTWHMLGNVRSPDIGIVGAITTFDILAGNGASAGAMGGSVSYQKNGALASIDLRAVEMPTPIRKGGRQIAHVVVEKQAVQEGLNLTLDRYFPIANQPRLINFEIGTMNREPLKAANRLMVNLAGAELMAQVRFHYERNADCLARSPKKVVVALH